MTTHLFLGGARSGKSSAAQRLALAAGGTPIYVATARPSEDEEFAARLARHRADRGDRWVTVEEDLDVVGALRTKRSGEHVVVVDCLTLWLANLVLDERDVEDATDALCAELVEDRGDVALVSNEVGQGTVPMHALTRAFRDHQGRLNQRVAAVVDRVRLLVAGIEVPVKG